MTNATSDANLTSVLVVPGDIIFNVIILHLISIFGLATNIFILTVIKKSKDLQTPCFLLIAGDCVCSTILAAGFLENAVEEAAQFSGLLPENRIRALCYSTKSLLLCWSIAASSLVTACISLDRLVSICAPIRYKMLGKRYAYSCLALCYVFATSVALAGFVSVEAGYSVKDTIQCNIYFSPFTPNYLSFYGTFNLSFCLLCVFLYGIVFLVFEWRRKHVADSSAARNFMKQQMACMPVVKLLMAYYTITAAGPEVGVAIMSSSKAFAPHMPRFFYYVSGIKASTCLAEICSLSLGSRQFRKCAWNTFRRGDAAATTQA